MCSIFISYPTTNILMLLGGETLGVKKYTAKIGNDNDESIHPFKKLGFRKVIYKHFSTSNITLAACLFQLRSLPELYL